MAEILIDEKTLASVKDRVAVVTGSARGIGAATVRRLFNAGAHVYHGDWDERAGGEFEKELKSSAGTGFGSSTFLSLNVRDYHAQLRLFDTAFKEHGRVDLAIYCAGIAEKPGWILADNPSIEAVKEFPQAMTDLIDINLNGTLYFTRIGLAYLNADAQGTVTSATNGSLTFSKSLTLVSSAAGFKESPGLCAYSASKHGIIGVVRALRGLTPQLYNVRVNAICPWATDTAMIAQVVDLWKRSGMPLNTADDIALFNIQCAADPRLNGRSVFVGGGKGFDIEEGIDRLEPEWLGKKQSDDFLRQAEVFGSGNWSERKSTG